MDYCESGQEYFKIRQCFDVKFQTRTRVFRNNQTAFGKRRSRTLLHECLCVCVERKSSICIQNVHQAVLWSASHKHKCQVTSIVRWHSLKKDIPISLKKILSSLGKCMHDVQYLHLRMKSLPLGIDFVWLSCRFSSVGWRDLFMTPWSDQQLGRICRNTKHGSLLCNVFPSKRHRCRQRCDDVMMCISVRKCHSESERPDQIFHS